MLCDIQALAPSAIVVYYLLVQGDRVLDISDRPTSLMWNLIDTDEDFSVVMGVKNEFQRLEIVAPVAEYQTSNGSDIWLLTSSLDGEDRIVNSSAGACQCLHQRLEALYKSGRLSDPMDFDYVLLVEVSEDEI